MDVVHILRVEVLGFLYALAAMFAYRLLTRQISLDGIFGCSASGRPVSPERVQLLMATLAMSGQFVTEVARSSGTTMPDVSAMWLTIFGASSGTYVVAKAVATFTGKQAGT